MKKLGISILWVALVATACQTDDIETKKKAYSDAREELAKQKEKVASLKKELVDAGAIKESSNISLVTTLTVEPTLFEHKVSVRGTVKSRGNVFISPEMGGQVTKVAVVEGQKVKMGDLLVMQDTRVLHNSVEELKTSLELATTMYERQKKLWEKNIGSEVQYLQAQNKKESLERRLATTQSQLDKLIIRAPFSGVIDKVDVRVGQNLAPGQPIVRLVSLSNMYIKANISEAYIGQFSHGQQVDISLPSIGSSFTSTISAVGQVIEPKNRTFEIEVLIPTNTKAKPNMVAVLSLTDYKNEKAIAVPTNIIFTDKAGSFVYQLKESNGNKVAIRADITPGITSGTVTEVLSGLKPNDVVIDKGIYDISNGSVVKIAK